MPTRLVRIIDALHDGRLTPSPLNQRSNKACSSLSLSLTHTHTFHGATAPSGPGPPLYQGFTITLRHTTRYGSSGRVISPTQRPLPDNTQKIQTSMPPGGIRSRNPDMRAVADPRLRPRGHWDRRP
jgi:hypothetical protein